MFTDLTSEDSLSLKLEHFTVNTIIEHVHFVSVGKIALYRQSIEFVYNFSKRD